MTLQSIGSFTTGILCVGLVTLTATAISASSLFNQIFTSNAVDNAVRLPAIPFIGQSYSIRNDGIAYCQVFPPAGGTINGLAADSPWFIAGAGGDVSFIAATSSAFYTISNNSTSQLVIPIAATTTLTTAYSGAVISLSHPAATIITLPAIANVGQIYRFILSSAVANAVTIRAGSASQSASLSSSTATPADCIAVACVNQTDVIFTASAGVGSTYEVVSNGTKWLGRGVSLLALGFTTA